MARTTALRCEHIGAHKLYRGDCRDVLEDALTCDLVLTDPPYGIGYITERRYVANAPPMLAGDDAPPVDTVPLMLSGLGDGGAIYLCTRFDVAELWRRALMDAGVVVKTPIVWDKTNHTAGDLDGDYGCQTELVLFAHKGRHKLRDGRDTNLWRIPRPVFGEHPTPKPVDLMARAIRNSSDFGNVVLDPFMGSGTTGVACAKLGRCFIGIETDERYFEIACRRIEEANKQPDLFLPANPMPKQLNLLDAAE